MVMDGTIVQNTTRIGCAVDRGERSRQMYGMGGGAVAWVAAIRNTVQRMDIGEVEEEAEEGAEDTWHTEWVLSAEVPEESDWQSIEFSGLATFSVEVGDAGTIWHLITTAVDSMAVVNCVLASVVQSHWAFVSTEECTVKGLGGKGVGTKGKVEIPNHAMVYQGRQRGLACSVVSEMPRGIQLLVGLLTIHSVNYRLLLDMAGSRIYVRAVGETMRLDALAKVVKRMASAPGTVLSLCSGMCIELYVMLELGFRIREVLVVELDGEVRSMLQAVHGRLIRVIAYDVCELHIEDLLDVISEMLLAAFAGPTSRPWSNGAGFDDPTSGDFMVCAGLLKDLEFNGRLSRSVLETGLIAAERAGEELRQEQLVGGALCAWNASDSGSAAERLQRYHVRGASMKRMTKIEHVNPNLMLAIGWRLERQPGPCLGVLADGAAVAWVANNANERRSLSSDERDRINPGLATGVSNGFGVGDATQQQRDEATGNAFSADVLWAIVRMWKVARAVPMVLVMHDESLLSQADWMKMFKS